MHSPQHVFLIPGFFGANGPADDTYFTHVIPVLGDTFDRLERQAAIHPVTPPPTASIRHRASHLLEQILATGAGDGGTIHLIGHSTGGLDARLLATPGVALEADLEAHRIAKRIGTVVSVSTPHLGTPLAEALARGTEPAEEEALQAALGNIGKDRELLAQITAAGIDLFDATVTDRETTRYGSVVTAVHAPGLRSVPPIGQPETSQSRFATLYRLAAGEPGTSRQQLDGDQAERLQRAFGALPTARDNDGVVPVLSQVHGEVIHATWADHLDVIGYFDDPDISPPHVNWIDSGAAFDRAGFESLWQAVATYVADEGGEAA